jgi:hypothetical protein
MRRKGQRGSNKMPSVPQQVAASDTSIHVLWINAGLSCDGDSVALTAAMQPSVEDLAMGALPGLPKVQFQLAARRLSGRGRFRPVVVES